MTKNIKKGYSPQAAASAIPDNEKVDKAYYDSLNKKPKRGLEEAGDDSDTLEAHMLGREHAVEVWRGEREGSDIMMMGNAAYRAGFEDQTEEIAAEEGDDSLHRDPAQDYEDDNYEDDNYEEEYDDDGMYENKITKSQLAQIIKEELAAVDIEEGMMDKIGTKFRSMTGRSTPQDKYKHYIAKANKMILDLATFMFKTLELTNAIRGQSTEELLKNPYDHDGRLRTIKATLKRNKMMNNDSIKKAFESLYILTHDDNKDAALQYLRGSEEDYANTRGHPYVDAVRWIDSYDFDDVADFLFKARRDKRIRDDDREEDTRRRNIDNEREKRRRDRDELNQRVAAKKYQKQVADERERELSRRGNRDNLSADTTLGAYRESLDRTKITKSKLAQIVQEEMSNVLEEDGSGYSWGMRPPPKAEPSVDEAAADSGVQQMIYDYIEDNLENGPLSLDNILTLTQPTADDAYAQLEDIWEEVLEAAIEELELAEEIVRVQDWNDPSSLPRWTI